MKKIRLLVSFAGAAVLAFIVLADECIAGGKIFTNQIGYLPGASKVFLATQVADSFSVIDIRTGAVRFSSRIELWKANDPASGLTLYKGDFSSLKQKGEYKLRTSSGDSSRVFSISDTVYNPVFRAATKGFYFQRCGMDLLPDYAGPYLHAKCHIGDAYFHSTTGSSGYRQVVGGWHDAGDYNKYVVNAGVTLGTLLMGYELFPDRFASDDLGIPESGNGVPDLLDEVRYELAWLLSVQSANGGVYFKVSRLQFESFIMPQGDPGTRYIYAISSTATADFAAVMARAARVYRSFDSALADTCQSAAQRAWSYLEANPSIVPAGGFKNPSDTFTGEYGDSDDRDERLWAAAELYHTVGLDVYRNYYGSRYTSKGLFTGSMSWPNLTAMAHLTYLTCRRQGVDTSIQLQLQQSLTSYCDNLVAKRNSTGFRILLKPGEFWWGCNSDLLNNAILLLIGSWKLNKQSYEDVALDQLHYILGANPHDQSFVTGLGSNPTHYPHHRPSASDGVAAPVPGLLAGGPDQYLDDDVLKRLFSTSTPPMLCYVDDVGSYASNEIAINWNAPLVVVSGYFFSRGAPVSAGSAAPLRQEGFRLEQNYPNPFNPATTIGYQLSAPGIVTLKVFDVLGKEVKTLEDGFRQAGWHTVRWDAAGFESGVYFYVLRSGRMARSNKLVLLK